MGFLFDMTQETIIKFVNTFKSIRTGCKGQSRTPELTTHDLFLLRKPEVPDFGLFAKFFYNDMGIKGKVLSFSTKRSYKVVW